MTGRGEGVGGLRKQAKGLGSAGWRLQNVTGMGSAAQGVRREHCDDGVWGQLGAGNPGGRTA